MANQEPRKPANEAVFCSA